MSRLPRQALVALLLLFTALSQAEVENGSAPTATRGVPITGTTVSQGTIELISRVQAQIESLNAPVIKSKVSAEVVEILVDEGDKVMTGDVLARLDDENFRLDKEAAEASIEQLEALLENLLLDLQRDEDLYKKKLVSDSQYDKSRLAVKQTRASIVHARALLKKAQYQLSHTVITTPVNGIIQSRSVSLGDYLNPMSPSTKPLFQVVDTDNLRARLYFPDTLSDVIQEKMVVTLRKGNQSVVTQINHIRPMIEESSNSLQALASFDNQYGWKPGKSIVADVVLAKHANALLIPATAIIQRPAGQVVYRIVDGVAQEVAIEIGIRQDDMVEVIDGLQNNDLLALDGAAFLSDGTTVTLQDSNGSLK